MNSFRPKTITCLLLVTATSMFLSLGLVAEETNSPLQHVLEKARNERVSRDPQWLSLLHYRRTSLGRYKSEIDGKSFFLSPQGRRDPDAELEATLKSFWNPPTDDTEEQSATCRFPARLQWLQSRLQFSAEDLPPSSCSRLEGWLTDLDAHSISMVYAASYLNNPASMYGHTFLRINRGEPDAHTPLLDYSINYAADTPERNGLLFAAKGLLGLYPGRFSTQPYYFKVQQYNNMEQRDLWEYTLSLSSAQVQNMLLHLWELGPTYSRYFFLNQNCSYQLLPLLDAAQAFPPLSDHFRFRTIPADTIRALQAVPGLVKHVETRPSLLREILARRSLLHPDELAAAEKIAKERPKAFETLSAFPVGRQALVLDSAYDYFRLRHGFKRFQTTQTDAYEREILVRRGELGVKSSEVSTAVVESIPAPESGHSSGRVGLSYGVRAHDSFEEFSIRPALHDLAEDARGYIPNSQLEMFHIKIRYENDPAKLHLERFTLIDIVSLSPFDRWMKHPSWKIFAGLDTARDMDIPREQGLHFRLNGGIGAAIETDLWRRETLYALAEADGGVGGTFKENYRAGFGGEAGLLIEVASFWRMVTELGVRRYPIGNVDSVTVGRWMNSFTLSQETEFRATLSREGAAEEALFTLHLYF